MWPNWNGGRDSLLLIGAYDGNNRSRIYGVSLRDGRHVGTVRVPRKHLGGMAIVKGRLVTQGGNVTGEDPQPVMKFRLRDLRRAMKADGHPDLEPTAKKPRIYGGPFCSASEGSCAPADTASTLTRCTPTKWSGGWLTRVGGTYKVPPRTQGLVVTADRFVFSTSYKETRGRMFVVKRTRNYETTRGRCFTIPSLPDGIAAHNGTLYMNFEAGASQFLGPARNEIARVHKAPLSRLTRI